MKTPWRLLIDFDNYSIKRVNSTNYHFFYIFMKIILHLLSRYLNMNQIFIDKWQDKIENIDYAIQPIVSTISGKLFGIEVLIRGVENIGFNSINDFFDSAFKDKVLVPLENALRRKVVEKVSKIKNYKNIIVFYNYDHRIMEMPDYRYGFTEEILEEYNILPSNWCLELNEGINHEFTSIYNKVLLRAKASGFKLAIDDFGTGFSNFELLYHSEADFLKLDKFLIRDIHKDNKKLFLVSAIKDIARALGVTLIAEGVETEEEYYCLKNLDIDMIQGYFIQKPTIDQYLIKLQYEHIEKLYNLDKRKSTSISSFIKDSMCFISPLNNNSSIEDVFDRFQSSDYNFIPIVDKNFFQTCIIYEKDLREYIYSPYGRDLLISKVHKKTINDFLKRIPKVDIRTKIDDVLKLIVSHGSQGIFITDDNRYIGFLSNTEIIKIINYMRMQEALETNPLSGLPGNIAISNKIKDVLIDEERVNYFIYFDFDNFKPFNDKFGFRIGDRAIKSFAEILKNTKREVMNDIFIGHIGGDDFFVLISFDEFKTNYVLSVVNEIMKKFKEISSSFFSYEEIVEGNYKSVDRQGNVKFFPLLGVSAAILEVPFKKIELNENVLSKHIAELKKIAKSSESNICIATIYNIVNKIENFIGVSNEEKNVYPRYKCTASLSRLS